MDTHRIRQVCENKLSIGFREGKHFSGWFSLNGRRVARITIPKGRKEVPPGTYGSMARQLKLSKPQFGDLLACPLKRPGYEAILREQNL